MTRGKAAPRFLVRPRKLYRPLRLRVRQREEVAEEDDKEESEEITPAVVANGSTSSNVVDASRVIQQAWYYYPIPNQSQPPATFFSHSESANGNQPQPTEQAPRQNDRKFVISSWAALMEESSQRRNRNEEDVRWKKPSIFRVPEWMKDKNDNEKSKAYYHPELVSLGIFHLGAPHLLPMDEHKLRAVQNMLTLSRPTKSPQQFIDAIAEVTDRLLEAYHNLHQSWRIGEGRDMFIWVMVIDGCFLLEFMRAVKFLKEGNTFLTGYAANDPVFSMRGILSKYARIRSDMLVLQNQIPLLVLKQLLAVQDRYGTPATDEGVNKLVLQFLGRDMEVTEHDELGMHPLDMLYVSLCGPRDQKSVEWHGWANTMPSAVRLKEAGIHFKMSSTDELYKVEFKNGVLSMPRIVVSDSTKKEFLNLMAFEHLHRNKISNVSVTDFVFFMDNIIDTEADVELLKKNGVIEHTLGSDKEVAELFNTMKKGVMMSPYGELAQVKREVNVHCEKTLNKWRASFIQTYLKNPWVFISLVAAVILLIATLLQTVYTVVPFYTKA